MSLMTFLFKDLKEKIQDKSCRICVMGAGYVGAELAFAFSHTGFKNVSAYEIDWQRILQIKHRFEKEEYASGKFHISADPTLLKPANVIIITVPTPLSKSRLKPDMSYIDAAIKEIKKFDVKGKLIILESTTSPFTTLDRVLPKFSKGGKEVGQDFFMGYSPERIDPNNNEFTIFNTTKIVSGVTDYCRELSSFLYNAITKIHEVSNTQTAEMIKLYENTFRNVNIGLACEIAQYCRAQGINVNEVIDGASTKEFGFMKFSPGLIGGHCIPLDIHYLTHHANSNGYKLHLSETSVAVHNSMPLHIYEIIKEALGGTVKGKKIMMVGTSYKPNVADYRESGALDMYCLLKKKKAILSYHDPYVHEMDLGDKILGSSPLSVIKDVDCVLILQRHDIFEETSLAEIYIDAKVIVDCVNAFPDSWCYENKLKKVYKL